MLLRPTSFLARSRCMIIWKIISALLSNRGPRPL
jgi:hypothetical protein